MVGIRTRFRSGCPFCAGRRVSRTNSLATRFPIVAGEWHPTLNGRLRPRDIPAGSKKAVWWRCRHDATHIFPASPARRTRDGMRRTSCPFCLRRLRRDEVVHTLAEALPVLRQHWHPTRNGDRRPVELGRRGDRPVWWRCPSNPSHPWRATLASWADRASCASCTSHRNDPRRSLAFKHPWLAAEWHPTRNGRLTPEDVSAHANKRVWWRCRGRPAHVWAEKISSRVMAAARWRRRECRFCAASKRLKRNSLAAVFPTIAAQWHPGRNGRLRPTMVYARSGRRVWWRCRRGPDHEWATPVVRRTSGTRSECPFCAGKRRSITGSLAYRFPAVAAQWHPTKNGTLRPDQVSTWDRRLAWWQCPRHRDHVWRTSVTARTQHGGTACPFCSNRRLSITNSLATRFPTIAAQWHPARNGSLTPDRIGAGSNRGVWWRCAHGPDHEWQAKVSSRTRVGTGCPACAGKKLSVMNSLATRFPAIAAQWHPTRNRPLTPDRVHGGAHRYAWWRCDAEPAHEWRADIHSRTGGGRGCPRCMKRQAWVTRRNGIRAARAARTPSMGQRHTVQAP